MKKVFLFLVVASVACVVGMVLMAPEPGEARASTVSVTVPAVPALGTKSVVLETGAELHIVQPKKDAPKPRPVAAKAKPKGGLVDCSNAKYREDLTTENGTGVRYCHN